MPDLLLEVLSEEIPARMQARGKRELEGYIRFRLDQAHLAFEDTISFATPRRLAVLVPGLPDVQPDITVERKGPRVGAPEKAIAGFLRSTGLTLADCEQRETAKGPVWYAVTREKGRPTGDLLADLLPGAIALVSWPKSMRWEETGVRWVRPIRSILCLLDDAVVPFRFGPVESGRTTLGHRFLSSGSLTVDDAKSYESTLEGARVMLASERRKEKIKNDALALAKRENLCLADDDRLLNENAGLVEWPVVLMGSMDSRFTKDLPAKVLRSAMGTHQRYFGLLDGAGGPAARFIMVANTETEDGGYVVVSGNERVLRARLADARFFLNQDRRQSLAGRVPQLKGVVFHAGLDSTDFGFTGLGSMYEKARSIEALARSLCGSIEGADSDLAARAGLLCKADLVTEMVGEFPDLQGLMGSLYAERHEKPEVCTAIREHYAPQGPDDECPTAPVSVAVALADKLDTLAALFAIDERPTGSKDPFALRRAALGVIRIIIGNRLRLSLDRALTDALNRRSIPEPFSSNAKRTLVTFFEDRLKVHLRDQGKRHDLVSAVFATEDEDDLVRVLDRVEALDLFLDSDDGANLLTAYRRAANILRIEEKKDGDSYTGQANESLFVEKEERILHERIAETRADAGIALEHESFVEAIAHMATLRAPVDAFFDNVTVNCDDPALRRNRLLMLSQIRSTLDRVADFSKIEG